MMGNFFFSRDFFADVMSVHNRNMKHARAIEFDYTNLLAMLKCKFFQSLNSSVLSPAPESLD